MKERLVVCEECEREDWVFVMGIRILPEIKRRTENRVSNGFFWKGH